MLWSISKSKIFAQCQRKWFYLEILASHHAKQGIRKEAYHLKQLQSVYAWRGSVVDKVIEKLIVFRLHNRTLPSVQETIDYAMKIADMQLTFAKNQAHKQHNVTKSNAGLKYCALYDYEYKGMVIDSQIETAKLEIKTALSNLLKSPFIRKVLQEHSYLVPQRPLRFSFADIRIACVPDLIVFYDDKPPLIVDWKVHVFGNTDYWLQLGIYALALSRTNPHRDYSQYQPLLKDPKTFHLIEYQLLKNHQKSYTVSQEDVNELEDYIVESGGLMQTVTNGLKYPNINVDDFQIARFPDICARCQFKKICWEGFRDESPRNECIYY